MFKSLFSKRHSVVFIWLVSYFVVLLIPIAINYVGYLETERVVEKEINRYNNTQMKQLKGNIDKILLDVEKLSNEVIVNTRIQNILRLGNKLEGNQWYQIYEVFKDLRMYKTPDSSIEDIYVFFKNLDVVVTPNVTGNTSDFFDAYYTNMGISYQQWRDVFCGKYKGQYISLNSNSSGKKGNDKIIYMRTFSIPGLANTDANIIIILDNSNLMRQIREIQELNHGTVIILDDTGKVMGIGVEYDLQADFKYSGLPVQNEVFYSKESRDEAVVTVNPSDVTSWRYISIVPKEIFWEKVQYIRNLTYLSISFCLLLGGIITVIFLKKNYNSLGKLLRVFGDNTKVELGKSYNEYSFIHESIKKTLDEKYLVRTQLRQQNKLLSTVFLGRLLKGSEIEKVPVHEVMASYDINFVSDNFCVILFYMDKMYDVENDDKELDTEENVNLQEFVLTNAMEELIGVNNHGYMVKIDGMMACIVNFKKVDEDGWKRDICDAVFKAEELIKEHFGYQYIVSSSCVHQTLIGISAAYNEALQVMEYKKVLGTKDIMFYDDMSFYGEEDYYYPLEKEQQLLNYMKLGEYSKVKPILDEIFQRNLSDRPLPLHASKCLMFDLISTMFKAVNTIESVRKQEFIGDLTTVEQYIHTEGIADMKKHILYIFRKLCDANCMKNENKRSKLVNSIKGYIESNYRDINMSLSNIAEYFSHHPVYLSKEFKEQSGESLLDYINKIRVNKSKELLKSKELSIEAISHDVGYYNTRTYTRAFVKLEGINPGKYRETV